jgi:Phage Tail Collar Domain
MEISNTHILIVVFILFAFLLYKINRLEKETFIASSEQTIAQQINQIYNADVDAVRNLSAIATQLTTGGITLPGNLSITGVLNILPSGLVMACTGTTDPIGWLICDGRSLSRTTYANLFSVIGVQFGSVDAATFKIPNYKGAFLRGTGTGSNTNNVAPSLNTSQGDAIQNHTHNINDPGHSHGARSDVGCAQGGNINAIGPSGCGRRDFVGFPDGWIATEKSRSQLGVSVDSAGTGVRVDWMRDGNASGETRPFNYGVNWIIKI